MTSKTLVAFYDSNQRSADGRTKVAPLQSETPGPGGSSSIRRLEARGNVVVVQKDQIATGETAIFDTKTNLITLAGGVVLSQCKSVIRGSRLLVDMTTGVSRVESDTGTVQVLVDQSSNKDCGPQASPPAPSAPRSKR
jgi:lipopolysaccharide export system protein LptA